MKVVERTRQQIQPMKIIRHGHPGKFQRFRFCGAGIDGVGGMGNERTEAVLLHQLPESCHISRIHVLCFPAAGIPGEKLRRIAAQLQGFVSQSGKALGDGEMTADVLHSILLGYAVAFSASSFSKTV